jgi:hypothetical protein
LTPLLERTIPTGNAELALRRRGKKGRADIVRTNDGGALARPLTQINNVGKSRIPWEIEKMRERRSMFPNGAVNPKWRQLRSGYRD